MSVPLARACALVLSIILPAAAVAAGRGDGGGAQRGGGAPRTTAPVARPAPVSRPQPPEQRPVPQRQAAPAGGGFNFNRDVGGVPQSRGILPQQRVAPPVPQRVAPPVPQRPVAGQRTAPTYRYAPNTSGAGPHTGRFHGPVIANPHHFNGTWGWNHGVAWRPAPTYWGGGFWGPWALGALAGAALFGAIVDDASQTQYPSYQVEPDSPGAEALQSYGLQQTACGPPNLVVIWGPDNSVVCAFPTDMVAPGDYQLDPATLDLIPASP